MSIEITTLQNGLRVVSDTIPTVETVSLGVWLNVGARSESPEVNGISHVLEHMAFKGTDTRSAKEIAEAIENVGGYMNAYTGRESTAYYVRLLKDDAHLGVDIIADILQHSTFHPQEFEREQSVILQEIGQTYDTPDDIIFDYFQETCFPNHPMGRPILGTPEIVQSLTAECVKRHMQQHYGAKQMVLAAAGNLAHKDLVSMAEASFVSLTPDCSKPVEPSRYVGGEFRQDRSLEQVHIVMGVEGFPYGHKDYYAASLLATMLGGGMSSRLFQEIREKRGLVYSIYAFHSPSSDTGIFGVYAGTSQEKASELMEVAAHELKGFSHTDFAANLKRAKAQLKASIMMGLESTSSRCEQLAHHMHIYGRAIPAHETLGKIDKVTPEHIQNVAHALFSSPPTLALLGPIDKVTGIDTVQGIFC